MALTRICLNRLQWYQWYWKPNLRLLPEWCCENLAAEYKKHLTERPNRPHVATRLAVGLSARDGVVPLLPPLSWKSAPFVKSALTSALVIIAYSSPSLVGFWLMGIPSLSALPHFILPILAFFAAVLVLPPVAIPLLPLLYLRLFPDLVLSPTALIGCSVWLMVAVFVLPAAFINVSVSGTIRSAYRLDRAMLFIIRYPRLYLEAWAISITATAVAFLLGAACPWGLFWSYLVILSAFNQALVKSGRGDLPLPLPRSSLVTESCGNSAS
jgi:hypothetical protein